MKKFVVSHSPVNAPAPSGSYKKMKFNASDFITKKDPESVMPSPTISVPKSFFSSEPRIRAIVSYATLQQVRKDRKEVEIYGTVTAVADSEKTNVRFGIVLGKDMDSEVIPCIYYKMGSDAHLIRANEMLRFIGKFQSEENVFQCFCARSICGADELKAAESRSMLALKSRNEF